MTEVLTEPLTEVLTESLTEVLTEFLTKLLLESLTRALTEVSRIMNVKTATTSPAMAATVVLAWSWMAPGAEHCFVKSLFSLIEFDTWMAETRNILM